MRWVAFTFMGRPILVNAAHILYVAPDPHMDTTFVYFSMDRSPMVVEEPFDAVTRLLERVGGGPNG